MGTIQGRNFHPATLHLASEYMDGFVDIFSDMHKDAYGTRHGSSQYFDYLKTKSFEEQFSAICNMQNTIIDSYNEHDENYEPPVLPEYIEKPKNQALALALCAVLDIVGGES